MKKHLLISALGSVLLLSSCGSNKVPVVTDEQPVTESPSLTTNFNVVTTAPEAATTAELSTYVAAETTAAESAPAEAAEQVTEAPTTEAPTTAPPEKIVWDSGGVLMMTFPDSWKDRFVLANEKAYCKKSWDNQEGSGLLFSIVHKNINELPLGENISTLIGMSGDQFVFACRPSDVQNDPTNAEETAEYQALAADLPSIFAGARGSSTPNTPSVDLSGYKTVFNYFESASVPSFWQTYTDWGGYSEPSLRFVNNSDVTYNTGSAVYNGKIMFSGGSTEPYTNGIMFIDSSAYIFSFQQTEPHGIGLTCVMGGDVLPQKSLFQTE